MITIAIVFVTLVGTINSDSTKRQTESLSTIEVDKVKVTNAGSNAGTIDFDWSNLISAVIGGIIGLSPLIISYFKRSKIKGKVISQYGNIGKVPGGENSTIFLQKISVFSSNKDFYLKDIEIFIKYPNQGEIKCKGWIWRYLAFEFDENDRKVQKHLNIDNSDYLLHKTIFPKDQSVVGYISFTHDFLGDQKYEYINYKFIDFNNSVRQLKITQNEIAENIQLFDNSIWT